MQLRGEIDQETYELVVQQAIARGMTIPQHMAFLVRRAVRVPAPIEQPDGATTPASVAGAD